MLRKTINCVALLLFFGIGAVIFFPGHRESCCTERSKDASVRANMAQLQQSLALYSAAWQGQYPERLSRLFAVENTLPLETYPSDMINPYTQKSGLGEALQDAQTYKEELAAIGQVIYYPLKAHTAYILYGIDGNNEWLKNERRQFYTLSNH